MFATLLVGVLAARAGVIRWSALAPVDRPVALIRVCAEIGVTSCFLQALFNMPLANATAILQGAPFALTFAAAVFLREKVGWRRWTAVMVGFFGVLLIVRPGGEDFNSASYYAPRRGLFSCDPGYFNTSLVARNAVAVHHHDDSCRHHLLRWRSDCNKQLADCGCRDTWRNWPSAPVSLFGGYLFSVMTMRVGEMSFIAPFRYTILIWALLLGIFVFGEIPDTLAFVGAAIVVSAGLYTFFRERRLS